MIRSTACMRLRGVLADDDALAGGQAVGLDDDRVLAGLDVGAGRLGVVEDAGTRPSARRRAA